MNNFYLSLLLLVTIKGIPQTSGVGIGTSNPQQKLHLASSVGTVRIEGLDKNNSDFNGGLVSTSDVTYPLYVNCNGVLSLEMDPYTNSDGSDAIDNLILPATNLQLLATDSDGKAVTTFYTYSINVSRPIILEIKYNISFDVYKNSSLVLINDGGARRISTFYSVDNSARRYGSASKCYFNNAFQGASGTSYNSSTTYIPLTAGPHTIKFKAEVSTALPSIATYVKLAVDMDAVFMRFY